MRAPVLAALIIVAPVPAMGQDRATYDDIHTLAASTLEFMVCGTKSNADRDEAIAARLMEREGMTMEEVISVVFETVPTTAREFNSKEEFCNAR